MAKLNLPYRRLADQFYKAARGKGTPEEWRHVGGLIDRNFEEVESVIEVIIISLGDETTPLTTGTKKTFRMPFAMTLSDVKASLTAASTSGNPTFDINEEGVSVLSTKLSVDANEETSTTATTEAVISDKSLAEDAEITIDVDVAGTGAAGAKVYMIGKRSN